MEDRDLANKSSYLLWIHGSIEQMRELKLLQNEDFLYLVRPFSLLLEVEENFKAIAPWIFPESKKNRGLKTALKMASDSCLEGNSHTPGLIILGGLMALFALLISGRSIALEQSFQKPATREEALAFLSKIFLVPIKRYEHPESGTSIFAYDATGQQYPIRDDNLPF